MLRRTAVELPVQGPRRYGDTVRVLILGLAVWTVIAAVILVFAGGAVNTPGCARLISHTESVACRALLEAANAQQWLSHTRPMVAVIVGGYALILVTAVYIGRGPRRGRRVP